MIEIKNYLGLILPPIIDLINVWVPNSKLRFVISALICFGIGYLVHYQEIKTLEDFLAKGGIIFTEAQLIYNLYWEKSKPRENMVKGFVGENK